MFSQELYPQKAAEIIRQHDPKTPLFLYVALQNVHGPQQSTQRLKQMYRGVQPAKRKVTSGKVDSIFSFERNSSELKEGPSGATVLGKESIVHGRCETSTVFVLCMRA